MSRLTLTLTLALLGCASRSSVQQKELQPGTFQLDCAAPLGRCSEEADRLCDGRGYDVVDGYDQRKLYGHEAGESQVEVRTSRLVVACHGRSSAPRTAPAEAATVPEKSVEALRCTPGTTQRCVGAAACEGGQSCLANGSGYGACDCGKVAPQTSPSPTPVP
jgi:hypothetical protein